MQRKAGDAVGGDDQVVAGLVGEFVKRLLPVADQRIGIDAPAGGNDGVLLPRLERGLADAGDDLVLGAVLVRAVVDLAQEEIGGEFGSIGLCGEDGVRRLPRALERAGAGGGACERERFWCQRAINLTRLGVSSRRRAGVGLFVRIQTC